MDETEIRQILVGYMKTQQIDASTLFTRIRFSGDVLRPSARTLHRFMRGQGQLHETILAAYRRFAMAVKAGSV